MEVVLFFKMYWVKDMWEVDDRRVLVDVWKYSVILGCFKRAFIFFLGSSFSAVFTCLSHILLTVLKKVNLCSRGILRSFE